MNQSKPTRTFVGKRPSLALTVFSLLLPFVLSGCGKPFEVKGFDPGKNSSSSLTPDMDDAGLAWKELQVDGNVSGGSFDKTSVVAIDKNSNELIVRLPMMANPFLDGMTLSAPVPQIPGASLGLESLPQGGSALALRVPLAYILRGVQFLPPSRLPNGDPLPAIPSGELPSTAVQLNSSKNIKATIYLAPTVIGVFVNTPFDPFIRLTFPVRNAARTRTWGYFSSIPAKAPNHDGGFFVSIALPDDIARVIDDHLSAGSM
jgi:hypothetical protein